MPSEWIRLVDWHRNILGDFNDAMVGLENS
jgi:hypothetical protein